MFGMENYGKMLFCPCPNYGTRLQLWRHFIDRAGLSTVDLVAAGALDLDTLAFISEGFSAGSILQGRACAESVAWNGFCWQRTGSGVDMTRGRERACDYDWPR